MMIPSVARAPSVQQSWTWSCWWVN